MRIRTQIVYFNVDPAQTEIIQQSKSQSEEHPPEWEKHGLAPARPFRAENLSRFFKHLSPQAEKMTTILTVVIKGWALLS